MLVILLRASSRVRNRADRGKLPRTWISLSVKSIASWGYYLSLASIPLSAESSDEAES